MAHFLMAIVIVFVGLTLTPTPQILQRHVRFTFFNENELISLVYVVCSVAVVV